MLASSVELNVELNYTVLAQLKVAPICSRIFGKGRFLSLFDRHGHPISWAERRQRLSRLQKRQHLVEKHAVNQVADGFAPELRRAATRLP